MRHYTSPLIIYVVWHPKFNLGKEFAEGIYSTFCRDVSMPFSRGANIPVFFRNVSPSGRKHPISINKALSDKNALILLIDEKMFGDSEWRKYASALARQVNSNTRIYPIAFSKYAFDIDERTLTSKQFISVHNVRKTKTQSVKLEQWDRLKSSLLHDITRQLMNLKPSYKEKKPDTDDSPVKFFLSHAKKDGKKEAEGLRDFIERNTKLDNFFDANDIADGHEFAKQIKNNLNNSALIVFHTDEYSNREWCRIEVITAKRNMVPVIIVHNIKHGENRSFPYMGNTPTIKWNNNYQEIIDFALLQVLKFYYSKLKIEYEIKQYGLKAKYNCFHLPSPPELFNYINIKSVKVMGNKKSIVLYPDPPLGSEELQVLNDINDKIVFTTPILIPSL